MADPGARTCPACNEVVSVDHRFCERCGAPLPDASLRPVHEKSGPTPDDGPPADDSSSRRRALLIAVPVAVLVLAAGVIAAVVLSGQGSAAGPRSGSGSSTKSAPPTLTSADQIPGLKSFDYAAGQSHVTTPVTYRESPPVGGPHDPEWADCTGTVYTVDIRHENAVHSMVHGATWITYNPATASKADIATLKKIVQGHSRLLMSPYAGQTSPISLQSWNHQLSVTSAGDKRVQQFVDFLTLNQAFYPEIGASCENPTFISDPLVVGDSSRAATGSTGVATDAPTTPTAAASKVAGSKVSCDYLPDTSGNTHLVDVGTPPSPKATPNQGTDELMMRTGQGELVLTLNRSIAPCAAASFTFLAERGFFDGSRCHREVNKPTFGVLQCGDPSGTGMGGANYRFAQEVTGATAYPRGTVAMANNGSPASTSSQFFLCFADSKLLPDYTVVGTVDEAGLAVLDRIAAAGNDGSLQPSPGGGAPVKPVIIQSIAVRSSHQVRRPD